MNANQINIIGRLARDPETKYLPSGMAVTTFSIAHNRRVKDKSGEWKDAPTSWFNVKVFGKDAELVSTACHKGHNVVVIGRIETEEWQKDGKTHSKQVVIADLVAHVIQGDAPAKQAAYDRGLPERTAFDAANDGLWAGDDSVPF